MKILLVSPEVAPYAKTGGLADVAGSLPQALRRLGHDVRVMLPCFQSIQRGGFALRKSRKSVEIPVAGQERKGLLRQTTLEGVTVYFIENQEFFDREGLYGTPAGDYADNAERFGFFCRAVLAFLRRLDFRPDVIHLNDWQTGLIPVLLRTELRNDPFYASMGTLLTIHNLGYQGLFPATVLESLDLPPSLFTMEALEYYGQISFLKGGIVYADKINTVSPTYRDEILTPAMGIGFDGILRARQQDVSGILNGLDSKQWDPSIDTALPTNYSAANLQGKKSNKRALQKSLGLDTQAKGPLVAMVTRLDTQKGLDIVEGAWQDMLQRDLQFVLLGSGEKVHTDRFARLQKDAPGRSYIHLGFDDGLARRIYAGSDLFLMPSLYEPCGLGQLIALRYGSLPLVRRTGGLADTVHDPADDPQRANGFVFDEPTPAALLAALDRALALYGDRRSWLRLVKRGMAQDFSWTRSAQDYLQLYHRAQETRHG
ncbi:glycogen synthase GlgA [Desulfuromonas sp. KJ2020]|uniref:glycogen synthase GlgA n=1 Tax=Desulfuromonas sp. KJ2020 TaxID=2919173 RepID=UPI0020A81395|nr:glycogen synthase GlgA [Desulfuromonas sp. KJ2020]MCP3176591.1 glycogen synthase GlgA [Desulfuromonas sp. KJ2020]